MMQVFFKKAGFVILHPPESFKKYRDEEFNDSLKYFLVLLVIIIGLNQILPLLTLGSMLTGDSGFGGLTTGLVIGFYIAGVIVQTVFAVGLFIAATVAIHIFVLFTGGKKDYLKTASATFYASTPFLVTAVVGLLAYILPFFVRSIYNIPVYFILTLGIIIIGIIWWIVLEVFAIREFHELPIKKATVVVLIPVMVLAVIVVYLFLFLFLAMM